MCDFLFLFITLFDCLYCFFFYLIPVWLSYLVMKLFCWFLVIWWIFSFFKKFFSSAFLIYLSHCIPSRWTNTSQIKVGCSGGFNLIKSEHMVHIWSSWMQMKDLTLDHYVLSYKIVLNDMGNYFFCYGRLNVSETTKLHSGRYWRIIFIYYVHSLYVSFIKIFPFLSKQAGKMLNGHDS